MGSLGYGNFRRWGVEEIGRLGDGEFRKWGAEEKVS